MSRRALVAALALGAALALAGCSQEGRLVETPLRVTAVAFSFDHARTDTLGTSYLNNTFKLLVHVHNACEAQHCLLELRRIDTSGQPAVYQISALAHYNVDDKCSQQPGGERDSAFLLALNGTAYPHHDTGALAPDSMVYALRVASPGDPTFVIALDSVITSSTFGTTEFDVRVEDRLTAALVSGATVAVDQLGPGGSATPLDSAVTAVDGIAIVQVPSTPGPSGEAYLPYRVRVTNGAALTVVSMPSFPARRGRREKLVVRI